MSIKISRQNWLRWRTTRQHVPCHSGRRGPRHRERSPGTRACVTLIPRRCIALAFLKSAWVKRCPQYPRDEYVLSSKVGRIMLDEMEDPAKRDFGEKGGLFEHGLKTKF